MIELKIKAEAVIKTHTTVNQVKRIMRGRGGEMMGGKGGEKEGRGREGGRVIKGGKKGTKKRDRNWRKGKSS